MKRGQVIPGSRTALVTGAGRGLGRQYAERLTCLGYNVILVGRSDNVIKAKEEIDTEKLGIWVEAVVCDMSVPGAANRLHDTVVANGWTVDVLVNNAGVFSFHDILDTSEEKIDEMINLHDITLTRMNRLFAADMAARGGGHILNMSSYSIWMQLPGIALYSATKAYVRNFSVAFSKEVEEKGIHVTAICPAGIATDLYGLSHDFQKLGIKVGALMTPENCARRALNALWRHKRYSVPDWWNKLFIPILMHMPAWAERMIRRKTARFQK